VKKFIIQFVLLTAVIFLALLIYTGKIQSIPFLPGPVRLTEAVINDTNFKVEVADTQAKRSRGLGGRESLASDSGMLFIFQKVDKYPFWMKGLKFPLDFIWIKDDKVVDILQNIPQPQPGQKDEELSIYTSTVPIDKVLEVNAGTVERLDIKVGDIVKITSQ